ncbi:flavin reductase family protein [Streptomyces sp. UC4497]
MPGTRHVRDLVVADRRPVGEGTVEVLLATSDGGHLPSWPPGAHIDLILPGRLVRPYSLAGEPTDRTRWRLLVRRSAGRGRGRSVGDSASAHVHDRLAPGDRVACRGPYDRFRLAGAGAYLFLASGAGIAPLLPMARMIRAARVYPWSLVHVDRSGRPGPLRSEVLSLGAQASVTAEPDIAAILAHAAPGTAVHVCGGGTFVDAVEDAARSAPHVRMHRQRFDTSVTDADGGARCDAYEAVLARRGDRVRVAARTPLLTALLDAGAQVPYSCGAGICGACAVPVLDGGIAHRDSVLTRSERDSGAVIITCVSGAAGESLVLDL